MTEWDGDGVDPFLPDRLAHELRVVQGERAMYNAWWGSFSRYLVKVRRGVFDGPAALPPNAHAIYSVTPFWAEEMLAMVQGPVLDVVGMTYVKLFGPNVLFDSRPAVTRYLGEVFNRLVRTPDEVFDLVAGEIAKGAGAGESIPKISARVDDVLSATGSPNWPNRATVIARTETLGALSAGREDAFAMVAETLGGDFEHTWLATLDLRVRTAHKLADKQSVPLGTPFIVGDEPLMRPGDPNGSPENVIQCRCTTLLTRPGEQLDMSGRGFSDADEWWASQLQAA